MSSNCPEADATDVPVAPNEHWSSVSKHVVDSYVAANNAFLAAMGFTLPADADADATRSRPDPVEASIPELAFGDDGWFTDRSADSVDDLGVGDYVRFTKPIDESDVSAFARVSGDTNRLHLTEEFAEETRFGGRIVHGTLVAGTISAALARFPGLTIYLSQDLEFHAPVEVGETVTATCEIVELLGSDQYRLHTMVEAADGKTVIDGEAVVVIDSLPDE